MPSTRLRSGRVQWFRLTRGSESLTAGASMPEEGSDVDCVGENARRWLRDDGIVPAMTQQPTTNEIKVSIVGPIERPFRVLE